MKLYTFDLNFGTYKILLNVENVNIGICFSVAIVIMSDLNVYSNIHIHSIWHGNQFSVLGIPTPVEIKGFQESGTGTPNLEKTEKILRCNQKSWGEILRF